MYEGFSSRLCYAMLTKPAFFPQTLFFHPISTITPNDPADVARHDRMVTLVTQMLDLNKKLQDARLEQREDDAVPAD
jgi:hypothetical protein